ncbi:hypothetical protein Btru_066218 [Bulinus truncatus]|nr:hypothetical protein Btru_066218 [Bulinus truncatus]
MQAKLFEVSDVYRGRRYYLNTRTYYWTANDAHFRCHMYGGYLAEIDDADEFDFVRNFLILKAQKFYEIVIGGSDEAEEGKWRYVYSNRPVPYFNWTVGQPDAGRSANNLCFWRDLKYYMSDCIMLLTYDWSYLCEIPEANVPY